MLKLVKVSGNSLLPKYRDGDFVVVSRIPVILGMLAPGDAVTFETKDYGTMIKIVDSVSPDGMQLVVKGIHPLSVDSRQIGPVSKRNVTGKVIWHIKKLKQGG